MLEILQMEKRTILEEEEDNIERCRKILQKGLELNPTDAKILQVPSAPVMDSAMLRSF